MEMLDAMEKGSWKKRLAYWAFAAGLFAFMMFYFCKLHPLMAYDGDDWYYAGYSRWARPIWGYWNPTRIFPETMMPVATYAAGYLFMPFVGDLTWSMAYAYATIVSLSITAYVLLLGRLISRRFGVSQGTELLLCALFTLLHFLAFRTQKTNNDHLFYCFSANTYFFYMIPALLNACLVIMLERRDELIRRPSGQGFAILMIYFAVFSNMMVSYVLAIYSGVALLEKIVWMVKERRTFGAFLRESLWEIAILALWLVSLVFELNGTRATILQSDTPYVDGLKQAIVQMMERLAMLNGWFLSVCVVCIIAAIGLLVRSKLREERDKAYLRLLLRFVACALISALYVLLVSAKAAPSYSKRTDVIFGAAFFCLAAVMMSAAYVMGRFPRAAACLPLLLVILFFETDTRWTTFLESNLSNMSPRECAEANNAMIEQIILSDKAGLDTAYVYVPDGPFPPQAESIAHVLLKCGLIERAIPYVYNLSSPDFYEKYEIWGHDSAAREAVEALKPTEETP